MVRERLHYFDMVKGLGIILVVLGHIEYISEELRGWISSFHMPLFFVVSGMLICYLGQSNLDMKSIISKRFRGIMIPYISFTIIYTLIDVLNIYLHKITPLTFVQNIISGVTLYGSSVLWFLPALFLSEIGFILLIKKLPRVPSIIVVLAVAPLAYLGQIAISDVYTAYESSLVITSLINFVRVFLRATIAMSFVGVAYYLFPLLQRQEKISWRGLTLGIVMTIITLPLSQINGCVDFRNIIFKNFLLFYLCALLGSFGLVLICKNIRHVPQICFFGENSLVVMCTHVNCYILYAAILIAWQIDTIITRAKSYVFLFNIMIFTFLFEAILIYIINRFFPWIIGKRKEQKVCQKKND